MKKSKSPQHTQCHKRHKRWAKKMANLRSSTQDTSLRRFLKFENQGNSHSALVWKPNYTPKRPIRFLLFGYESFFFEENHLHYSDACSRFPPLVEALPI